MSSTLEGRRVALLVANEGVEQLELTAPSAGEFDALALQGGVADPDLRRADGDAVALVRAFVDRGKPVPAFCEALVDHAARAGAVA